MLQMVCLFRVPIFLNHASIICQNPVTTNFYITRLKKMVAKAHPNLF